VACTGTGPISPYRVAVTRARRLLLGSVIGLVVGILIVTVALSTRDDGNATVLDSPNTGDLPDDRLVNMDGSTTSLVELSGRVMVVNFWQKSCAPCRKEMPAFEQVHQSYGNKVRFVGVNGGDELSVVADYVAEVGVTYDIVRDPRYEVATEMEVAVYPATFVVSPAGKIVGEHYGELGTTELTALIDKALIGTALIDTALQGTA
jgi:thiol-disulfide isomerase/thioredoxin